MTEENHVELDQKDNNDWFLQHLVSIADEYNTKISLTLIVGGTLISGILITSREYFDKFGEALSTFPELSEENKKFIKEDTHTTGENEYKRQIKNKERPLYIHLIDVVIFNRPGGLQIEPSHMVCWRGRISEVQGFFLGTLKQPKS